MNEPTVTRGFGQDVAWSNWQAATDRADAPHPDPVRAEATPPARPLPGAAEAAAVVEGVPSTKDVASDAAFPQSYARFSINEKTQRISIKIVDAATDEVLREIPSEEVQRIAEDLQALARRNSIGKRPQQSERGASGGVDRYV
jgi:flagellar protein FlaG